MPQPPGPSPKMPHLHRTVAPCEAMVQTVLVNSGRFELCQDNRRYTDFAESRDGRPRTLISPTTRTGAWSAAT